MRIALIAHHVAPIAPPFVGGVESHTWYLGRWLAARGHQVTLFGLPGSSIPGVDTEALSVDASGNSALARADVSSMPTPFLAAHHGYLSLMVELAKASRFDAIHVNTLHYLPVAMARALPVRPVLTLHCPPTPWLESALAIAGPGGTDPGLEVTAVSSATAESWKATVPQTTIIANGVDAETWIEGPGGPDAVWFGRFVPEKAPHLAIEAARLAGRRLQLAGPIIDHAYFAREIQPRLDDRTRFLGHLGHDELVTLVGQSGVAICSPDWNEPFGLVAAEAMACGTPVAAFDRGGLAEVIGADGGALARAGDVASLADAIERAARCDRPGVRAAAIERASIDRMGREYEALYRRLAPPPAGLSHPTATDDASREIGLAA
jgi:glycosyltransferase involved in cell wall biosynthesis